MEAFYERKERQNGRVQWCREINGAEDVPLSKTVGTTPLNPNRAP
jgi:hypothetical protein